jgi:hypothetical protein
VHFCCPCSHEEGRRAGCADIDPPTLPSPFLPLSFDLPRDLPDFVDLSPSSFAFRPSTTCVGFEEDGCGIDGRSDDSVRLRCEESGFCFSRELLRMAQVRSPSSLYASLPSSTLPVKV